jgi:beta-galactosidase
MQLVKEMGVNSLRLAHYQQSGYFYSLCDSAGMVVWAEIPFVGSMLGGYTNSPEFRENGKQQMKELIRQNYNHPSICFWGVFNELSNPKKESPASFVKELAALAKEEDPGRITTSATLLPDGDELNFISEVVAWNKYFGWYYGAPDKLGKWADKLHKKYPQLRFAISEYGAGAGITQHEEKMRRPFPINHPWHPEEYQAFYHEKSWKAISERPYIWGSYVWNMFDFSVDFRIEGDTPGLNDKGLVTYDRKTKKDAFYFYKANWNEEPMVHINDKRFIHREAEKVNIKVYSNLESVELFVNGLSEGILKSGDKVFLWKNIKLASGNNQIKAVGRSKDKIVQDQCVWVCKPYGFINGLIWFLRFGIVPFSLILIIAIPLLYTHSFRKRRKVRLKILFRVMFFTLAIVFILLLALFLFGLKYDVNLFDYSLI